MLKLTSRHLTKTEQKTLIQAKLTWILSVCKPLKVILFGSAAREEMRESSDIDLIIIFHDKEALRIAKDSLNQSRQKGDWPQDLLFYTDESFSHSVAAGGGAAWLASQEGIVLYSQKGKIS